MTSSMQCIVEHTDQGDEIGLLVGVHESPVKVRNDGTNLAGTVAILRHYSDAAQCSTAKPTSAANACWSRAN